MKMTPELKKAFENMQPGVITADGFLGDDDRFLVDIIEKDEEKMNELELEYDTVVKKMRYFMEEGRKGLGESVKVDNKWLVRVDEARGFLPCPFEDGIFRKINVTITNLDINESLTYSDLVVHLLEKHHFHQGLGSFFRIEPKKIKLIFDI
jgi:hypothetical protein